MGTTPICVVRLRRVNSDAGNNSTLQFLGELHQLQNGVAFVSCSPSNDCSEQGAVSVSC